MQIDGQAISDDILYKILSQVCIYSGSESIKNLKEILNREEKQMKRNARKSLIV